MTFSYKDFYSIKINILTLEEAFKIHYQINPQFTPWYDSKSEILKKTMRSHDISHIIYGCDTTLLGEMKVQFWNQNGSYIKNNFKDVINALMDKYTRQIITPTGLIPFFLTHLSVIGQVSKQAKLMSKKWHWFEEDKYMYKTIGEIRQEYNIVPLSN